MGFAADDSPIAKTDATAASASANHAASGSFPFRILDVVLITTLAAMLLAAVVQYSGWLLLAFAAAGLLCLRFAWKVESWKIILATVPLLLCALILPAFQSAPRGPTRKSQCSNNLKLIGIALQNYHDVHGCFPPAYIADENGKPMHSWRVLILPYMEQKFLYDQYRFDEPRGRA